MAAQRADIAVVVGMYVGKSQEELARAPEKRRRRIRAKASKKEGRTTTWYVVVDEIIEDLVTLEAWPWPTVSPDTRFLQFDLGRANRMTFDAVDLHSLVSRRRRANEGKVTAERPLRIGDVFRVSARKVTRLDTWTSVRDRTDEKRGEARAALDAMAAPTHQPKEAQALEKLARAKQESIEPTAVASTKVHSTV